METRRPPKFKMEMTGREGGFLNECITYVCVLWTLLLHARDPMGRGGAALRIGAFCYHS